MTTEDLVALFEKHGSEFLRFERIENPKCKRPDVCAFIRLDELVPESKDMVSAAEHDEIYLAVDAEQLAACATEDDIIFLARCGVRYDSSSGSLAMFV